jgi:hypothetical protein
MARPKNATERKVHVNKRAENIERLRQSTSLEGELTQGSHRNATWLEVS